MKINNKSISILAILPAYNEKKYLNKLIPDLKKNVDKILIINDGSTDNTKDIVNKFTNIILISNTINKGKGESLKAAFNYIKLNKFKYDYFVILDADLQHAPWQVRNLLRFSFYNSLDVCIGKRNFYKKQMPRIRSFWNYTISRLHFYLFGINISDSQSGFRVYNEKSFFNIFGEITQKNYNIETEINIIIREKKLTFGEVEIDTIYNKEKLIKDKNMELIKRSMQILFFLFKKKITKLSKYSFYLVYLTFTISIILFLINSFNESKKNFGMIGIKKYEKEYVESTNWLKTNTPENSIILTEWTEGHQVVLLSKRRVIATSKVYPTEAKEIYSRYADLAFFFYSNNQIKIKEILNKHEVNYVFIRKNFDFKSSCRKNILNCNYQNEFLQSLITGNINKYDFLKKTFENNSIIIYKYKN